MRMYVVTRRDLSPEAQASQSCQVLMQFNCAFPALGKTWYERQNSLDVLLVPDEDTLKKLFIRVRMKGAKVASYHEPHLRMQLTAIAVDSKKFLGKLTSA